MSHWKSMIGHGYSIATGLLTGKENFRAVGYNAGVGASLEDVAEQGGLINRPAVATAMQIDGSSAVDTGVVIYTSTTTGGSTTTLVDGVQDFTAGAVVAVGDMILLDDDVEFGVVSNVTPTTLTVDPAFSGGVSVGVGDNYRIVDKDAGGLGAQVMEVEGLDGSYAQQSEFVITNGVGTQNLAKSFLRVNSLHVMFLGGDETATGTILLEDQATGAVTYAQITSGGNQMFQALYTVPEGKTMYITDWQCSASGNMAARIMLRAMADHDDHAFVPNVFLFQDLAFVESSAAVMVFPLPIRVLARADVKVSAIGTGPGAEVAASFGFWIE